MILALDDSDDRVRKSAAKAHLRFLPANFQKIYSIVDILYNRIDEDSIAIVACNGFRREDRGIMRGYDLSRVMTPPGL